MLHSIGSGNEWRWTNCFSCFILKRRLCSLLVRSRTALLKSSSMPETALHDRVCCLPCWERHTEETHVRTISRHHELAINT